MRLEIFVLGLTGFFVYNAYADGKYTKMLMTFKKYYKMIFYVVLGLGIYLLLKKNPNQGKNMLLQKAFQKHASPCLQKLTLPTAASWRGSVPRQ